jgi:hypothetical protein
MFSLKKVSLVNFTRDYKCLNYREVRYSLNYSVTIFLSLQKSGGADTI